MIIKFLANAFDLQQRGYTFLAEARTTDLPLASGKWRMRLIGSSSPLPQPARDGLNSSFFLKEIRDYYIPNKDNIIMRYPNLIVLCSLIAISIYSCIQVFHMAFFHMAYLNAWLQLFIGYTQYVM